MSRSRSDMYQVDFVAALFGGFLLIWLSGATDSEPSSMQADAPRFFEIAARNIFTDGNSEDSLAIVPLGSIGTACIHASWLRTIYRSSTQRTICHGSPVLLNANAA